MSLVDLQNKTILVTGASNGIGRVTVELLAKLGARVVLVARNQELLKDIVKSLPGAGHIVCPFDLSQVNEIGAFIAKISSEYGLLDGLVHAAGIHMAKPLRMLSAENLEDIFRVNVTAGIMLAKAFRQKTVSARPASIVFISSVVALVGQPAVSAYAMSKGAICAATKSLAAELAPEQIRVNAVLPGVVMTSMTQNLFDKMGAEQIELIKKAHPLGLGQPLDVANMIAFLLSDAAKWITGTDMIVDGGYTAI